MASCDDNPVTAVQPCDSRARPFPLWEHAPQVVAVAMLRPGGTMAAHLITELVLAGHQPKGHEAAVYTYLVLRGAGSPELVRLLRAS